MEQYNNMTSENININDILEVIQTTDPGSMATITMDNEQPYVKIIEQPASKALRFRYECEGRSAGSIPGANSTPENKTFPSIRIVGYKGRAMVVVSCVTKDAPHRPHPHNLVGKEVCRQGVCTVEVPAGNMIVTFSNLGIQCVKKKDIEEALKVREELRVDPFRTGFEHKKQPTNIDLNAVRLCFQVFLEGSRKGKFTRPLDPIVSDPIYDKKAMSDLVICKLSHCSAPVAGGMEMILLCEKVAKEDIQVRFFEEEDGQLLWEGFGDFQPTHVHKQTAIAFRTPTYRIQQVEQPVQVHIQLKRPSDGATSEPLPFQMLPLGTGRPAFWSLRKAFARKKADYSTFSKILATETALLSNVSAPKFVRNIDEFNNNDLDAKRSNGKMSALRALNDLYNVRNHTDACNGDLRAIINSAQNVDQTAAKGTVLDYENNEVTVIPENTRNAESGKDMNKLYTLGNNNLENDVAFTADYDKGETIEVVSHAKSDAQNDSAFASKDQIKTSNPKERSDWFDYSEIGKWVQKGQACLKEKNDETELKNETEGSNRSFNEFLSQVAELDQIYADTHTKLVQAALEQPNAHPQSMDVDVCDNQTYTSLQMAMKNPVELFDITDDRKYEDIAAPKQDAEVPVSPPTLATKRDVTREAEERLPPLPPKRIRKMPSMPLLPRPISAQTLVDSSEAPNKNLPSLPGTLPKHSKQGLFSKLFAKKTKKDKCSNLSMDSDSSLNTSYSLKSSVQDGSQLQLPRPSMTSVTSVKSLRLDDDDDEDDKMSPYGADLTEAEHYALYTTMAPHATASEFDEMSFYYSLVEDDMDSLRRKRQKFSNNPSALFKHVAETEKRARNQTFTFNIVKAEPADQMPPFGTSTNTTCGFTLQSVTKKESNTLQNSRIKVSPGRTPSPMEYNNTPYSSQQHSPQYQPIVQNEPIDRLSPFGGATAARSYTLPLSVMNHQQNIMPGNLRPQISPGRTPSPMEYSTAYSPSGVQQQQQQSPQYQPNISSIIQMPSSSISNANLYSYASEQTRLQQAEPNLYSLGKAQENMSHTTGNQGLQPVELNNAGAVATSDVIGVWDMDTQQLNFDLNPLDSNDFTDFGSLSANLSSGLSLTDGIQPTTSNAEESQTNSMTEETNRIIWIKQELSTLNNIFKPNRRNDDGGLA